MGTNQRLTSRDVAIILIYLNCKATSMSEGLKFMKKCDPTIVRIGDSYRIDSDVIWRCITTDPNYRELRQVTTVRDLNELQGEAMQYFLRHGEEELFY